MEDSTKTKGDTKFISNSSILWPRMLTPDSKAYKHLRPDHDAIHEVDTNRAQEENVNSSRCSAVGSYVSTQSRQNVSRE